MFAIENIRKLDETIERNESYSITFSLERYKNYARLLEQQLEAMTKVAERLAYQIKTFHDAEMEDGGSCTCAIQNYTSTLAAIKEMNEK